MRKVKKLEEVDNLAEKLKAEPTPEPTPTTQEKCMHAEKPDSTLAEIVASAPTTLMLQTDNDFNAKYWLWMERLCKHLGVPMPNGILCPSTSVLKRLKAI